MSVGNYLRNELIVCSSMNGSEKRKFGNLALPRCFKNIKSLTVTWITHATKKKNLVFS